MYCKPIARLVVLGALLLAAACGDSSSSVTEPDASTGTYTLRSADGQQMPGTLTSPDGLSLRFESGTEIRLIDENRFSATFNFVLSDATGTIPATQSSSGAYNSLPRVGPGPIPVAFNTLPGAFGGYDATLDPARNEIVLTARSAIARPKAMVFRK